MRQRHETGFAALPASKRFCSAAVPSACHTVAVKRARLGRTLVFITGALSAVGALGEAHAEPERSSRRVTGITTIYPWEAEVRAAAGPNGEPPFATIAPGSQTSLATKTLDSNSKPRNSELPNQTTAARKPVGERVEWGAPQDLAWRAALPSSGIGTWGANPVSHPERALVEVLVGGAVGGVGVVLEGGAVLTSLSTIARGIEVSIRFADGTVEAASVRRTHRAYDLALLEPFGNKVRVGLPLARTVVEPLKLLERRPRAGDAATQTAPSVVNAVRSVLVSWFGAAWGADGVPIAASIRPPNLTELGSPLITSSGHLAALVTLGCVSPIERANKGPAGCHVTRIGLASSVLGEFLGLVEVDPANVWFGVVGETTDTGWARGVRVKAVEPGSPAAYAGLRAYTEALGGDVIVAIDNSPVLDLEQLNTVLKTLHPGAQPVLTVLREGRIVHIPVQLPTAPRVLPRDGQPSGEF